MLDNLTAGERLIVLRHRKQLTQKQMAKEYGVTKRRYGRWERDGAKDAPLKSLGELKPHEECYLRRKRAGKTQEEIALSLGLSRVTINKMENNKSPCDALVGYWNDQGEK